MTRKINSKKKNLKRLFSLVLLFSIISLVFATPVLASAVAGGNPLLDSAPVQGIIKFLNDATTTLLFIVPIVGGILIIVFSLMQGGNAEQHDKDKWKKNRTTVIWAMCWAFGATGIVKLITMYIK